MRMVGPLLASASEVGVSLSFGARLAELDATWLRERSAQPGQVDPFNRQRLYTPTEIDPALAVRSCLIEGEELVVDFSDGHRSRLDLVGIARRLGWMDDREAPPAPEAWAAGPPPLRRIDWSGIGWATGRGEGEGLLDALDAVFRLGFVVFGGLPVEEGTVCRVGERLGYTVGQNFGKLFDVRVEHQATDLAYTARALVAHTDQPYRQPPPGLQLLHCLANDAPGGDSTLADGLAAWQAMRAEAPELCAALEEVEVEFRYDVGVDTVVGRGHIFEVDRHGRFLSVRFNPKLDSPDPTAGAALERWFAGRRWLTDWLDDSANRLTFHLGPGDLVCMDNHRLLHGRTAFDPGAGFRHLQGCYIERDGPDTLHRLAMRHGPGCESDRPDADG